MIFVEFLVRNAFAMIALWDGLSELVEQKTRFMPKQSLKMVQIDLWDTESPTAISVKLKWRFSVTISSTLAMLTSVEDVDGQPERGKSSITSRPLLNALTTHMYALLSILRKPSLTFSAIPHSGTNLASKRIFDNLFNRAFLMINSRYFFDRMYVWKTTRFWKYVPVAERHNVWCWI